MIGTLTNKLYFAAILAFVFILMTGNSVFAQSITSLNCTAPTAVSPVWPRNVFTSTCTLVINRSGRTGIKVGVNANSYSTNRTAGTAGPTPITYTNPEDPSYRFKANGPLQAGTPVNINIATSVAGGIVLVKDNINTDVDANFTFDLLYTTYEADTGGTVYRQLYAVRIFRSNNAQSAASTNRQYNFTIANRQYVNTSATPAISLTSSNQVFNTGQYYDSNTYTVNVKANNTWKLQTKLVTNPTSGGDNIPVNRFYYKCTDTASFICSATARTQYTAADTYRDVATNNAGTYTTGTTDNINLNSINVSFNQSLLNSAVTKQGVYSTTHTLNVHSPNP